MNYIFICTSVNLIQHTFSNVLNDRYIVITSESVCYLFRNSLQYTQKHRHMRIRQRRHSTFLHFDMVYSNIRWHLQRIILTVCKGPADLSNFVFIGWTRNNALHFHETNRMNNSTWKCILLSNNVSSLYQAIISLSRVIFTCLFIHKVSVINDLLRWDPTLLSY